MQSHIHDIVIVGAGIVGVALARELVMADPSLDVIVVEKEGAPARHQSGRNSGVIHSGLYYRPDSMKARCARRGRERLMDFMRAKSLRHRLCGKVILAVDDAEKERLVTLEERGRNNGVTLGRLSRAELKQREPALAEGENLFVHDAGVTDYAEVTRAYAEEFEAMGGQLRFKSRVERIDRETVSKLVTSSGSLSAQLVVLAGGLESDRLARIGGLNPKLRILPFRGEYHALNEKSAGLCRGLIYPVPDPEFPFLGVHLTRGINDVVHCGPNAVLAFAREGYRRRDVSLRHLAATMGFVGFRRLIRRYPRLAMRELWRASSRPAFAKALRRLVPAVQAHMLKPCSSGVRAQALDPKGRLVDDFVIEEALGVVAVLNAPSPAATAALGIAEELRPRILEALESRSGR